MTYVWTVEEIYPYEAGCFIGVAASARLGKKLADENRPNNPSEWRCIDPKEDDWVRGDLYVTRHKVVEE